MNCLEELGVNFLQQQPTTTTSSAKSSKRSCSIISSSSTSTTDSSFDQVKEEAVKLSPNHKRLKLTITTTTGTGIDTMMSSGPVETEYAPKVPSFRRGRSELRLSLQRSISSEADELKSRVKTIDCNELAKRIRLHYNSNNGTSSTLPASAGTTTTATTVSCTLPENTNNNINNNNNNNSSSIAGLPFLLLDCRGYLCYTDCHIRGAVHIACTDRFNRKRVQNSGTSVLDLVSTNNRRNKSATTNNGQNQSNNSNNKWRDVIVYDDGNNDLNLDDNWTNPISFVLAHLLQENRQPIYLTGGIKEFVRYYSDLCDTSCENRKDLTMDSNYSPPPLSFLPSPTLSIPCPSPPPASTSILTVSPSNYNYCTADSYENEPPTQVLPYLYVGNARDANNPELLKKLGISYVLSVTNTKPHQTYNRNSSTESDDSSTTNENSNSSSTVPEFRTKLIPVSDNLYENLAPYFEEACDFIEEARKSDTRVLIHCHAGISRSPTIAIAYIMKYINMTMLNAYSFVQLRRRIISPNLNFMGQLVEYESKLKGYATSSDSSCASSTSSNSSSLSCYSSCSSDIQEEDDFNHAVNNHSHNLISTTADDESSFTTTTTSSVQSQVNSTSNISTSTSDDSHLMVTDE